MQKYQAKINNYTVRYPFKAVYSFDRLSYFCYYFRHYPGVFFCVCRGEKNKGAPLYLAVETMVRKVDKIKKEIPLKEEKKANKKRENLTNPKAFKRGLTIMLATEKKFLKKCLACGSQS